jgi:hypothetical protein
MSKRMGDIIFDDRMLWNWACTVARVAQQRPDDPPEKIADELLAVVMVVKAEKSGDS